MLCITPQVVVCLASPGIKDVSIWLLGICQAFNELLQTKLHFISKRLTTSV